MALPICRHLKPASALLLLLVSCAAQTRAQDGAATANPPAPPVAETNVRATEPKADSTETVPLGPVEVRGKRNLFDDQAAKRRKLVEESAPCLGCDAKPLVHKPKLLERLANSALNQVTPQAAPEPDDAGKTEHDVMVESRHPTNSNP